MTNVNAWVNCLTSLNFGFHVYKTREQITESWDYCRDYHRLFVSELSYAERSAHSRSSNKTTDAFLTLLTETLFDHYSASTILNLWLHLLNISILPHICPYWTSSCFWFIEVTLTSIPVFWGVRIYAFLNLYSVDLISKGWKEQEKPQVN